MKIALLLSVALTFSNRAEAVDRTKFRKCSDTGFCRSFRNAPTTPVQYSLDLDSVKETGGQLVGKVSVPSAASVESSKQLNLRVSVLTSGSVRLKISEDKERWQPLDVLLPTGITLGSYTVLQTGDASIPAVVRDAVKRKTALAMAFGLPSSTAVLVIHASPLKFELYQGGVLQVTANERSLMHYEQSKETSNDDKSDQVKKEKADRHGGKEVVDYGEDGKMTIARTQHHLALYTLISFLFSLLLCCCKHQVWPLMRTGPKKRRKHWNMTSMNTLTTNIMVMITRISVRASTATLTPAPAVPGRLVWISLFPLHSTCMACLSIHHHCHYILQHKARELLHHHITPSLTVCTTWMCSSMSWTRLWHCMDTSHCCSPTV